MCAKSQYANPRSHYDDTNHPFRPPRKHPNPTQPSQKTGEPLTITQNGIPFAIISPIKKKSLMETLSTLEPLDEDFADVDEGLLPLDDIEFSK